MRPDPGPGQLGVGFVEEKLLVIFDRRDEVAAALLDSAWAVSPGFPRQRLSERRVPGRLSSGKEGETDGEMGEILEILEGLVLRALGALVAITDWLTAVGFLVTFVALLGAGIWIVGHGILVRLRALLATEEE